MPPRRRAFRSNNFGLKPTTIPRDAKRQAEPPSRQGTHSHQNHFRFNPSRRLVEPHTRFAASNEHPRLNLLPRRDFPAHAPLPGVAALPSSCPCRGSSRKMITSIVPEGHTLNNPTQATKERNVGVDDGTDTLSRRGSRHCSPRKGCVGKMRCLESCSCRSGAIRYITTKNINLFVFGILVSYR